MHNTRFEKPFETHLPLLKLRQLLRQEFGGVDLVVLLLMQGWRSLLMTLLLLLLKTVVIKRIRCRRELVGCRPRHSEL